MSSTSTLIGVAVSIAGNTCISIGLIMQKLSHIRTEQEYGKQATTTSSGRTNTNVNETSLLLPSNSNSNSTRPSIPIPTLSDSAIILPSTNVSESVRDNRRLEGGRILFPVDENSTQKKKKRLKQKSKKRKIDRSYLRSPLWWLGLSLLNLGELGNFIAYAFAPASLVAPLGTVALVANVIFAPLILKESSRKQDLLGVALSVLGGVTLVISSHSVDKKLFPDELLAAISTLSFMIYSIVSIVLLVVLAGLSRTHYGDKYVMIDVGVCAIAGGGTVLSTKAFSSFLNLIFLDTFKYPITYPILFVLLSTALIQVNFINKSLQRFESRLVIPFQFVSFSLSAIIGSAVLYREFDGIRGEAAANFGFGCAVSALGVYVLTRSTTSSGMEELPYSPSQNSRPPSLHLLSPQTPLNRSTHARNHSRSSERHLQTPSNPFTSSNNIDTPSSFQNLKSNSRSIPSARAPGLGARTLSVTLGGGQYLLSNTTSTAASTGARGRRGGGRMKISTSLEGGESRSLGSPRSFSFGGVGMGGESGGTGGGAVGVGGGRGGGGRRMSLDDETDDGEGEIEGDEEMGNTETEDEEDEEEVERSLGVSGSNSK